MKCWRSKAGNYSSPRYTFNILDFDNLDDLKSIFHRLLVQILGTLQPGLAGTSPIHSRKRRLATLSNYRPERMLYCDPTILSNFKDFVRNILNEKKTFVWPLSRHQPQANKMGY